MPLLQGQPFKLIKSPDILPLDSEVYTIQHTGEKFLNKSDYEDRLALYSQNIWTCQCTGHTGMTHKEAWMSEAKCRVAAKNAVPYALQKPLLSLVHHSLSPLEQLIDAASILCHSQFHVGEDVLLLYPKQISVKIVNCKENSKMLIESCKEPHHSMQNGLSSSKDATSLLNGNSNGMAKNDGVDLSPGKENQAKDVYSLKEESSNKRDMLPKLYDVRTVEDKKLIEDVPSKSLLRPYKVPSKDQLRLFIRSCALRHRGSTCTPWVVSEDLVKKFSISNKLPSLFLSSPKPNLSSSSKRKAQSPVIEVVKRPKADLSCKKPNTSEASSVIVKTENKEKPVNQLKIIPQPKKDEVTKILTKNDISQHSTQPVSQNNKISPKHKSPSWGTITKHPLSMGKPKILPKPSSTPAASPTPSSSLPTPRKRGRPPLSKEEKERNRLLRQKTLIDLSNKISNPDALGALNIIKVTTNTEHSLPPQIPLSAGSTTTSSYLQLANSVVSTPYRSPVKRATTPESIMKLPVMRRFVHEYKTIKGVVGQFRRYAYTMDLVLSKLSSMQIDMIPDEALKKDLYARQKKVQDKKFFEKLTPEEKKQFLKDKARTVALERWKERKLKNLKVEDKLVPGLAPLPAPALVETPETISNAMFGDIVMITDFIKCFRELLLGEEKFRIPSTHLMEAAVAGPDGYQIITDLICCFLPTIIHDDISKNCKEIGVPISSIPISYQTAHELARLCLTKQEEEESYVNLEDNYLLGKEKNELSDELLSKLECCELWELSCQEIICVLKALVHKTLTTAAISVYVEEIEEKVLQTLRERRKFLKQVQKEQKAILEKKKEERKLNKIAKDEIPKKKRGRPKGYSPKIGAKKLQDYFLQNKKPETLAETVQKRRLSAENLKKEKAESLRLEKERQKQLDEIHKRHSIDKKYEEVVFKRDNLLRRTPIGFDRDHNRYWIFHTSTPGLYVEKGWVDHNTDYKYSDEAIKPQNMAKTVILNKIKTEIEEQYHDGDEDQHYSCSNLDEGGYVSSNGVVNIEEVKEDPEDKNNKSLSIVKSKIKMEMEEDNQPLSHAKSKLTLSPMKMTFRGRPSKETYILVDEDTQTFPVIGENKWYHYKNIDEVMNLLSCLSDQGQRESQLIAAININRDRLQYHFNKKPEPIVLSKDSANRVKESLKEDIIQIARELIEGWLGGIPNFAKWEAYAKEVQDVESMGKLLIDVQRNMQLKNLKGIMSPVKKEIVVEDAPEGTPPEYEDVEGPAVEKWRDAVRCCRTYSRLHVLVGIFDSCIKWEKSMATRKCKVCRNKAKQDPLVICGKCENGYHWYCLRPPLKEDPGEFWSCPACMPKKTRREEAQDIEQEEVFEDQDEKDDPTFSLDKRGRPGRAGGPGRPGRRPTKKPKFSRANARESARQEKECIVCFGRIGLISCSKCLKSYHSECHNPPLMSRARKDWVCGPCKNPRGKPFMNYAGAEKPETRRNYFENLEERQPRNNGPRDKFGRFLPGGLKATSASALLGGEAVSEDDAVEILEEVEEDEIDYRAREVGRSIRGAKAKALKNIAYKNQDSRRSNRNRDNRKNYRDESEESGEDEDDDDNEDAEDSDRNDVENGNSDSNENNDDSSDEDDGGKNIKGNEVEEESDDGDGDSESGDTSAGDDDDEDDDDDDDDDDEEDDNDGNNDNNKDVNEVKNENRLKTEPLKPTKQVQGRLESSTTNSLERNSKIKTLSSSSSSSSNSSSGSSNSSSSGSSSGSSSSSSGSDSSSSESDSDGDGDGDGSNCDDKAFKESGRQYAIKTSQPSYRKKSPEVVDID